MWGLALLLAMVTAIVFGRAVVEPFQFLYYDDHLYVFKNPQVVKGLSWENIAWAFHPKTSVASNWHPLTMISHMADCQIFGLNPWGHHLTAILWHVVNVVLLFFLWHKMTGAIWRSALVAALFAWHPLHVESVAWISERKDVLSTFFWLVGCWIWADYARRPGWGRYLLVCVTLVLGLLSKPMVVTFPFALLLLDYWPLNRYANAVGNWRSSFQRFGQLTLEKLPMIVLVAVASYVTLRVQAGSRLSLERVTIPQRVSNAALSYDKYLAKLAWPSGLATPYLLDEEGLSPTAGMLAAIPLVVLCGLALALVRRVPYLFVGWFWFLGTLVPVIGLVQVGIQAMADRYSYIPYIGLFVAVAWGLGDLVRVWPRLGWPAVTGVSAALVAFAVLAFQQVGYWRDTPTLLRHAIAVTGDNHVARFGLGAALRAENRFEESVAEFDAILRKKPDFHAAYYQRALALQKLGEYARAADDFAQGVRLGHGDIEPRQEVMMAMAAARVYACDPNERHRNSVAAIEMAEHARDLTGGRGAEPLDVLAAAYADAGRFSEAIARAQMAQQIALRSGKRDLAMRIETRLQLYRRGQPYRHDPSQPTF